MRIVAVAVVVALLPLGGVSAGSAEDPEIADGCGDRPIVVEGDWPPPWLDIDAGWLAGDAQQLVVTLQMCAPAPPSAEVHSTPGGVQGLYGVAWDVDGCTQRVRVEGPPLGTVATFHQTCDGKAPREAPIAGADVVFDGATVAVTLRFDGDLAAFAFDFAGRDEIVLERPRAATNIIVNHGQAVIEGEAAGPGRAFALRG